MKNFKAFDQHLQNLEAFFNFPAIQSVRVRRFLPKTKILILSPHPDDEIISGALALRLQQENRCEVINVAVTLGSNADRKTPRRRELANALSFLKWKGHVLPELWSEKEKKLVALLKSERPALIIAPHLHDYHPAHIKTAELTVRALRKSKLASTVAWAEYWSPQAKPNFLVGIARTTLMKQVQALSFHQGEIKRNPYHLTLPSWQMDNVRRGSEWLGGKGALNAQFAFGQLYRIETWENGKASRRDVAGKICGPDSDLSDLLVD